jgi:branched-chain amino acid transport system permease protein
MKIEPVGRILGLVALVTIGFSLAGIGLGPYATEIAISLAMWIALSESWAAFSGTTGYVSLGHAVFFGLGGYVTAVTWGMMPVAVSLILSGAAAGLLALLVGYPCLRVRGPYFVMLTFGIAEFVKYVVVNAEAANSHFGRIVLAAPESSVILVMMAALAAVSFLLNYFLQKSRFGFGLRAIREDEDAAETSGVPVVWQKLAAFCLSAIIPGAAGGVYLLRGGYFEPLHAFDSLVSVTMITMAVIGGTASASGPLAGATLLFVLSNLLSTSAPQIYMMIQGALLVFFVLKMPDGIEGRVRSLMESRREQLKRTIAL